MKYPYRDTVPYCITQISTVFNEVVSNRLDEYGISIPSYRALVVLQDGVVRTLKELAQIISVEQSTLSRQLGAMVKEGLVTRTRPEDNGRIVRIEITDRGRQVIEKLIPAIQNLEEVMLEGIRQGGVADLKSNLKQIAQNLQKLRDTERKAAPAELREPEPALD